MNILMMKWQAVKKTTRMDKSLMVTYILFPDSLLDQLESGEL